MIRVPGQVRAERDTRAQHSSKTSTESLVGGEGPGQLRAICCRVHQPAKCRDGEVRVSRSRQRVDQIIAGVEVVDELLRGV